MREPTTFLRALPKHGKMETSVLNQSNNQIYLPNFMSFSVINAKDNQIIKSRLMDTKWPECSSPKEDDDVYVYAS